MKRLLYSLIIACVISVIVGGGYIYVKDKEWKSAGCDSYITSSCAQAFDPLQLAMVAFIGSFSLSFILLRNRSYAKPKR